MSAPITRGNLQPTKAHGSLLSRGRILVAGFGVVLGLVVAEIGLRFAVNPSDLRVGGVGGARWVAHPFLPFAGRPGAEIALHVKQVDARVLAKNNAYGFRAHEFPEEKHPEDFFIICLGGSTTWGAAAASNAETWPEILERLLQQRYPHRNVKAFNFGTDFANSVYSIVTLSLVGVYVRPDLVIVYHGWNDIAPAKASSYRTDYSHHFADFDPAATPRGLQVNLPGGIRTLYTALLVTFVIDDWMGVNDIATYVIEDRGGRSWSPDTAAARVLENLRTIHSIARGHGAQVIFSTFQFFDGAFPFNDQYRDFFEGNGFLYVDQDRLIADGDPALQFDIGHFTKKGREAMAQNFFDYIVAQNLLGER
jgi:lysophospholipase L1-like esterase